MQYNLCTLKVINNLSCNDKSIALLHTVTGTL